MTDPRALAVDACPNARRCFHHPSTRIGPSGQCPDCGTQVFQRATPVRHAHGAGAFMAKERAYNGGWS